jgi:hypothetical protein
MKFWIVVYWIGIFHSVGGDICERIKLRHEMWEGEHDDSLPAEHLRLVVRSHPGNETLLSFSVNNTDAFRLWSNVEPFFVRNMDDMMSLAQKPQLQIAVLVSGQVRTMLERDVIGGYTQITQWMKSLHHSVHIFAYLELNGGKLYRRHYLDPKVDGPFIPSDYVINMETVIQGLESLHGDTLTFVEHRSQESVNLFPNVPAECPHHSKITSQAEQFLKVAAAMNMVEKFEATHGTEFDIVLRIRPDMCPSSIVRFLQFSIQHIVANPLIVFIVKDAVAVLPRWSALAYASAWRTFIDGCPADSKWTTLGGNEESCSSQHDQINNLNCLDGSIDTHLIGLGVETIDLHKFWVPVANLKNASVLKDNEPALRRPHGCVAFN